MRQRVGHTGKTFFEELAQPELVCRVRDRPQQTHRHRFHAVGGEPLHRGPRHPLVESPLDTALRIDAFQHFEGEPPRDVGRRRIDIELEGHALSAAAVHERVGKPRGTQHRRLRRGAGHDRVGRARGAVDQHVRTADQRLHGKAEATRCVAEPLLHPHETPLRSRGRLSHRQRAGLVGHHHVGEGSPGVDRDPIGHVPRLH